VLFSVIVTFFCVLWNVITLVFCLSRANGGTALLLTDGSVLMQECSLGYGTRRWWKLVPDNNGSYFNGTWRRAANSHVARKYFSSAVVADGRVLVFGAEYSDASGVNMNDETNRCEIYDPVADTWTEVGPPQNSDGSDWEEIGDGACALLADGTFLMGNASDMQTAIFDPATNTWRLADSKNQRSSEESWVLLQDATVITANCSGHPASERYDPPTDSWNVEDNLPVEIVEDASKEVGPAVMLSGGRVFYVGCTGKTAIYTPPAAGAARGTWAAGPDLPDAGRQKQGAKDGPGCWLTNDQVLFGIAPVNGTRDDYLSPTTFFEFDGTNANRTSDPPNSGGATYVGRMLLLPTGDVMFAREDDSSFYAYTDYGPTNIQLRPVVTACPNAVDAGTVIQISGLLFNGFTQAVGYGDDSTAATNYPLVRIKNNRTGHIRYCRTFNHTTVDAGGATVVSMGVATGNRVITTNAEVPFNIEAGESQLFVVANGIESEPFRVTVIRRKP